MAKKKVSAAAVVEPPKGFKRIITDKIKRALDQFRELVSMPIQNDEEATKFEQAMLWAMERQKLHNSLLDPVIKREKEALDNTKEQKKAVNEPYATVEALSREALRTYRTQREIERQRMLRLPKPAPIDPAHYYIPIGDDGRPIPTVVDDDIPAAPAGMVVSDAHTLPVMPVLEPVITVAPPETTIPMHKAWFWVTENQDEIIKAVNAGILPREIIIVTLNQSILNDYAGQLKEQMNTWPGGHVEFEMRPIGRAKGPRA